LSFSEFLRFKGLSYDLGGVDLPPSIHADLIPLYKEFVLKGSYPAIALEEVEQKQEKKLKEIIATCLNTGIPGIVKIRNIQKFNRLVETLAAQTGSLVNISELSETAGLAKQSVEEYLSILEDTCFIRMLRPFFHKIRCEFTKMPKVFFEDSGIAHILENRSFSNRVTGNLFENSVFSELRKQFDEESLCYWRTSKNQEVDFIINKNGIIPIEAKLLFKERELTSLRYFVKKYGLKKAFVCTLEKPQKSPCSWLEIIYPWEIASALNAYLNSN
jgi:predicted AAA+ superfamily ATPase